MPDEHDDSNETDINIDMVERTKASLRIVTTPGKPTKVECIMQVVVSIDKIKEVPAMIADTINEIYAECYKKGINL